MYIIMIKVCEYCGKEFETENKRVKYCCKKCAINYGNKKHQKSLCPPTGIYYCKNCGKTINYVHGQSNYGVKGCIVHSYEYCCYECGVNARSLKFKHSMTPEKNSIYGQTN